MRAVIDCLNTAARSTGRRSTVHPYGQEFEAYGLPATWLSDDPRSYKTRVRGPSNQRYFRLVAM